MKNRSELENKYIWDLSDYFATEKDWNKAFEELQTFLGSFKQFEGKLNNHEDILKCLQHQTIMQIKLEVLYVWAHLRTSEDATNSAHEERLNRVQSLATTLGVETSFVHVELSNNDTAFLNQLKNNALFSDYDVYLDDIIRHKPHILPLESEMILEHTGEFASGFSNVFNKFNDADIRFPKVKDSNGKRHVLSHSNYANLLESKDRELRKNAMIAMHKAYKNFNNTLSANYIANVKKNAVYAKIKHFESAIEQSVFGENASKKVYETLIASVKENLVVFHSYFELKRKTLGYEEYAVWDNFSKMSEKSGLKLEFHEAIELIKKACKPLGKEYVSLLDKAVTEKWIDYGINLGKDSGAFSTGAYSKKPVVLMSYEKNTQSVFTLAHELGHALHTYYSNQKQPYPKAGYEIFVAEVASNVNEMLLLFYLLNQATDKDEKLFLLDQFMSNFRGSVLRQTMFAEFEEFAHAQYEANLPISSDVLNKKYWELNQTYFGKNVVLFDELQYEWSRIPHFYNAFYVYKYATGLICAIALTKQLIEGKSESQKAYQQFLSAGCSLPPIELLKQAGANLESKKTFDQAFGFAKDMLKQWQELLK